MAFIILVVAQEARARELLRVWINARFPHCNLNYLKAKRDEIFGSAPISDSCLGMSFKWHDENQKTTLHLFPNDLSTAAGGHQSKTIAAPSSKWPRAAAFYPQQNEFLCRRAQTTAPPARTHICKAAASKNSHYTRCRSAKINRRLESVNILQW